MELCKEIVDVLEANDMIAHEGGKLEYAGRVEIYKEIEFHSPAGEDVIETIWFDGTDAGFVKGFRENAGNFDIDDHTVLWIDGRGKNGVPGSISELLADAAWIKATLMRVAGELDDLKI